jgi:hypothetical protein
MKADEKAKELGAVVAKQWLINWAWSYGFPSKEKAIEFVGWLDANGYEHRGIYDGRDHGGFDVRWRPAN